MTYIVEVTFQFSVYAENDENAIADAKQAVVEAFPGLESPDNVSATIEGEI
jgi:hypothetical protein